MKRKNEFYELLVSILFAASFGVCLLIGCEKEYNADTRSNNLPISVISIEAKEFSFPVVKEIGQSVTYYLMVDSSEGCQGWTYETIATIGISDLVEYDDRVSFVISGSSWMYAYEACCNNGIVCDMGFIVGSAN